MDTHTSPRTRIILGIATLIIALTVTLPAAPEGTADTGAADATATTVAGATAAQQAMVDWALSRYETAGLELPALTITYHGSTDGCRGYQGYYDHTLGTVDICNHGDAGDPRRTLLHELGHAWSYTHMTEEQVAEWTHHRGLDQWHADETPWWKMSKEHAAEIIAWGLQDDDEYQSIWLHLETCDDLAAAYELLTGTAPLHTNTRYCK